MKVFSTFRLGPLEQPDPTTHLAAAMEALTAAIDGLAVAGGGGVDG